MIRAQFVHSPQPDSVPRFRGLRNHHSVRVEADRTLGCFLDTFHDSCPPRTYLLPRSGVITLANICSTGKPVDNRFLTKNSHFPTAPLCSRDNNVMRYSERTGRNFLSQETGSSCFDSFWSQQS